MRHVRKERPARKTLGGARTGLRASLRGMGHFKMRRELIAGGAYPDESGCATQGYRILACHASAITTASITCTILLPARTGAPAFSIPSVFAATS